MRLKTVRIQHYKSLDNVTVDLHPGITVIVGPNGVGKSNFVDVLRFLHDAVASNLDDAIRKREGIVRLLQYYKTRPSDIYLNFTFKDDREEFEYYLRLGGKGNGDWYIVKESLSPLETAEPIEYGMRYVRESSEKLIVDQDEIKGFPEHRLALGMLLRQIQDPQLEKNDFRLRSIFLGFRIIREVSHWSHCTIYPNILKKPANPDRSRLALEESGENWATVIKSAKPATMERIYEAMRAVLPDFRHVKVGTVGSYLIPRFFFASGEETIAFDPIQLSDGTLRLFGILLAAYQQPPPRLLVIEEPEQTIYPGALAVLADVFSEISETTQVIITTHSPHLISHFTPDQIRVAYLQNGLTQIANIHPHQMEAIHEGLMSLGEFMATEGLQPAI
nr:AAA family ATPase [uncultured Ottowia sp.]